VRKTTPDPARPRHSLVPAMHAIFHAACLSGLLAATPLQASEPAPALSLLDKMSRAVENVSFDGTLVYLHGQDLSALRISHRVGAGGAGDSLLSLTGPVRTMSRHAGGVTCMLPDVAPLNVGPSDGAPVLPILELDVSHLGRYYEIGIEGRFRVAGRDTDLVTVRARDAYRYGYRFFVDRATGLPLKVDKLDEQGSPVQQIMFTTVEIADVSPNADDVESSPRLAGEQAVSAQSQTAPAQWTLREPPAGFRLVPAADSSGGRSVEQDDDLSWHLVYTDGLASFSVYVEPPADGALQGPSRLGAVNAVGGRIGDAQVTIVGEVPMETVRAAFDALQPPQGG
jgi:sigma-E factor negative regulatory protein RseB